MNLLIDNLWKGRIGMRSYFKGCFLTILMTVAWGAVPSLILEVERLLASGGVNTLPVVAMINSVVLKVAITGAPWQH
jgi:hypothetical protein